MLANGGKGEILVVLPFKDSCKFSSEAGRNLSSITASVHLSGGRQSKKINTSIKQRKRKKESSWTVTAQCDVGQCHNGVRLQSRRVR